LIKKVFIKIINNQTNFSNDEKKYLSKYVEKNILKQSNNNYTLSKKYKIGVLQINSDYSKLLSLNENDKTIKIDNTKSFNNGDLVVVQLIFNPRGAQKAKIYELIEQNQTDILCYVKDNCLYDIKTSTKINTKVNISSYVKDDILLLNNSNTKLIGKLKDNKIDEKVSLYLYNQEYRLNNYTSDIKDIINTNNRVDFTNLDFCTIDPVTAKDHDDAIYYDSKNKELYVAIADVSAFIKEGSILDIEARKRAFSIYMPNKVLPMLPFSLSANLCSLKPNEKRSAYIFKIKLNTQTLEVIYSDVFEATIISKNKYSYEQIDDVLDNNNKQGYEQIIQLYNVTKRLRTKRLKNGFDFRTEELRLKLNNEEKLETISVETSSASHQLIEECMLLANCEAAKKLKGIGIFRIHDAPTDKKIEKLIDDVLMLGLNVKTKNNVHQTIENIQQKAKDIGLEAEIDKLIIQSQQQARYGSKSLGHFGLGFSDYSHFTSPIRRYSDLVLHRILKTKQVPKDIDTLCEDISNKEREIAYLVWDLEDRKYARWAFENINLECEAVIVDVENKIIKLTNQMIGARMICEGIDGLKLFTQIKILIVSSDILSKAIMAKII